MRARDERHLEALQKRFPRLNGQILVTPNNDYRFRIKVDPIIWLDVVIELAREQD